MRNFLYFLLFCVCKMCFALSCPPAAEIKRVTLIKAIQNPFDSECWNFISSDFIYDGLTWNVVFGTFIENVKSKTEALKKGRQLYRIAKIFIPEPEPISIPNYVICDYTSNGETHWITALSPPSEHG